MFKKKLTSVVTCNFIAAMKAKEAPIRHAEHKPSAPVLNETVVLPGVGLSIPVRAAKAKLSALLELVAGGQQVPITSDGKPKAVPSPVIPKPERKVFAGLGDYLKSMPLQTNGPFADEIIRADRDGRGW